MCKLLLLTATLLLSIVVYGQRNSSVELELVGRYDKHANYTTRFGDRSYTNDTKLWGKCFGVNVNFVPSLHKHLNGKVGIGYYSLGIDKIRQTTPFNFIATGRNINYRHPSGILPLFGTKKYHYDNLSFTLGLALWKANSQKSGLIDWWRFQLLVHFFTDVSYHIWPHSTQNQQRQNPWLCCKYFFRVIAKISERQILCEPETHRSNLSATARWRSVWRRPKCKNAEMV